MHSGTTTKMLLLALTTAAGTAMAATGTDNHTLTQSSGLPFLDARLTADETTGSVAAASISAMKASQRGAARAAAIAQLAARVPMLAVDEDAAVGTIKFLRSPSAFLTGPSRMAPVDAALAFVDDQSTLMEVNAATLRTYPVTRNFETSEGLMHHLTWQQQIGGLDLFGNELRINVARGGEIINAGSTIIPMPESGWNIPAPALDAMAALHAAAANVGITMTADPIATTQTGVHGGTIYEAKADFGDQDPIEIKKVLFARTRDKVVPAWWMSVPEKGVGNTYDMVIDATDGSVLWRHNRLVWDTTQPVTYRIYTGDSPAPLSPGRSTPDGFQAPFVARTLLTIQPAEISVFSPNGWIPDGQTATVGNNVDAYLDAANDNTASAADRATGTSRVFDFTLNVGLNTGDAPAAYQPAVTTQLFYYANRFHDRLYALGFNEVSGNFQTDNLGRGGTAADAVKAESQDGSGTNNANFSTSGTDGSVGRCQMYTWTGPNPDRDGSLDGDIVYHEMAHGLSIRLHRGGLTGTQGGGMGEGWSDFFALCLNAESGDDFSACYAAGAYATYNITTGFANNYYYGIRRFPYSADMNKSPLTFADIDTAQFAYNTSIPKGPIGSATANEVHNVGEVWCQVLLEMRREIGVAEGFNANQISMQLAVDGMKLAPATPSFLNERDTILQADLTRYGGIHQAAIWAAFAKRGMGVNATSPTGGGTTGIVENYNLPQRVDYTFPDGVPTVVSPAAPTSFRVTLTPTLITLTPGTQQLFYSVAGGTYSSVAMSLVSGTTYTATIPAVPCFSSVNFYVSTGTSIGERTSPATGASAPYSAISITSTNSYFADDAETNKGWTLGVTGDTATTGRWERAVPQATLAQPGSDHTPGAGTLCFVTGAAAGASDGANDVDGGFTTLLSPVLNLAGANDAVLSYWRWYSNSQGGAPNADTFRVDISNNNGSTWTNFETVGPAGAGTSGGWINFSRRIADVLPVTSAMRVRFVADDAATGSLIEAAIDDIVISATVCVPPAPPCPADFNQDGGVDGQDVVDFFGAWEAGDSAADVNQDGGVDGSDITVFFTAWQNGGC